MMPVLPKFSPLQSRFAASFTASAVLLLVFYLTLTKPHFAYALELDSRAIPEDLDHYFDSNDELGYPTEETYILEEGRITGRAEAGVAALANNAPQNSNIDFGQTQNWVFPEAEVNGLHGTAGTGLPSETTEKREVEEVPELKRRQDGNKVYISLNTCLQPSSNVTNKTSDDAIPPQLTMYISLSASNQKPGADADDTSQQTIRVEGGYALFESNADSDVYVGISAPNTTGFDGIWNYEVAASIDAPFHGSHNSTNLYFVDGDNHAALLITNDTTEALPNSTVYQEWMSINPPWGVFAANQDDKSILGVKNSYCGLMSNARIAANIGGFSNQNVAKMTNRGLGGKPKEQFYLTGLNATSKYWGMLTMVGNSTASGNGVVGGGGAVWEAIEFQTKTENNCALMYNLSFCSEVAYAVPTNPEKYPPTTGLPDLAALYDSYAAQMYQYFNYSLQQIPCNITSSAQYSLARNCDDCARAYKQWLCAVTIPRCADYSDTDSWLMPRNLGQPFVNGSSISDSQLNGDQQLLTSVATNSSRNSIIDETIKPGPYKEVLPCQDLCYDLVQSCPASLGFACPLPGPGLESSYGSRSNDSGIITCSYLGAAYYLSAAQPIAPLGLTTMSVLALVLLLVNAL
jgi:calcium channel MID1